MPFVSLRGHKAFYYQNSDYEIKRPNLILIHGAGGTGRNWVNQLSKIKGYNLIAPDLPGHGLSEGSPADTVAVYQEFIEDLARVLNLKSYVIAGHSMGGAIALQTALANPQALNGQIIIDSGARLKVNPKMLEALSKKKYPLEIVKYSYFSMIAREVLEQACEEMKTVPTEVLLADFQACDQFNIMDRVKQISTPTLIICGQDDRMTPVKSSEYLAQEIRGSKFILISEAGHMSMLEQPQQVNKVIQDFLWLTAATIKRR